MVFSTVAKNTAWLYALPGIKLDSKKTYISALNVSIINALQLFSHVESGCLSAFWIVDITGSSMKGFNQEVII